MLARSCRLMVTISQNAYFKRLLLKKKFWETPYAYINERCHAGRLDDDFTNLYTIFGLSKLNAEHTHALVDRLTYLLHKVDELVPVPDNTTLDGIEMGSPSFLTAQCIPQKQYDMVWSVLNAWMQNCCEMASAYIDDLSDADHLEHECPGIHKAFHADMSETHLLVKRLKTMAKDPFTFIEVLDNTAVNGVKVGIHIPAKEYQMVHAKDNERHLLLKREDNSDWLHIGIIRTEIEDVVADWITRSM